MVNSSVRVALHDLLSDSVTHRPDAPALTAGETTLTYGQLWQRIHDVARGLVRAGVGRGDRVAIYLEKRVETVVAIFAISMAGGTVLPANPLLRGPQLHHVLDDCAATTLITSADRWRSVRPDLTDVKSLTNVHVVDATSEAGGAEAAEDHVTVRSWDELTTDVSDVPLPPRIGRVDTDMGAVLYTSGSTGRPKGVVLSHRNMIVGAESVSEYLRISPSDRILAALPLSFDAGLSQLTTSFSAGAHVVVVNYLLPKEIARLCAEQGITGLTGVPPLWIQLAELDWPQEAVDSLRFFANTGGRMPRTTLQRLRTIFPGAETFLMYGLTEAFRSTYLDPSEVDRRPDSIGKAIPNAEILVVREDGSSCEPNEPGELVHRGPLVCLGYWNDPERSAERFRPAPGRNSELCVPETSVWSGDIVVRDEEGFLYFVGRRDEMIKTSGYRVSPSEIEEVAYALDAVQDAVAFGVDDPRLGQKIVLIVTPREGRTLDTQTLLDEYRSQLPRYMTPKDVAIRDSIPRSPNGKFDRAALRAEWVGPA